MSNCCMNVTNILQFSKSKFRKFSDSSVVKAWAFTDVGLLLISGQRIKTSQASQPKTNKNTNLFSIVFYCRWEDEISIKIC